LEPETTAENAERSAERIRMAVAANAVRVGSGDTVRVQVSAGTATFPHDGASAEEIVKHVDNALYAAKEHGRNRTHRYGAAA
jgi:diguanylate cyclase (GGDEF)-like protein